MWTKSHACRRESTIAQDFEKNWNGEVFNKQNIKENLS